MPKRFRNGEPKLSGEKQIQAHDDTLSPENLESEILALGGSKEDYELITGAPSDSEFEDTEVRKSPGKSLQKDLKKLVKELGIAKAAAQHLAKATSSDEEDVILENGKPSFSSEKEQDSRTRHMRGSTQFPIQSDWHATELPSLDGVTKPSEGLPVDLVDRIHVHAKTLLEAENQIYGSKNKSATSAHQFYSTIMSSGTLSDKISALTLSVQESPVHNMKALETLLSLAGKRSRAQAVEVLGALKDLFGPGALLPSTRKLRQFVNQPGLSAAFACANPNWKVTDPLPKPLEEVHLISWAYEDWLKSMYFEVIKIIETWCNDEIVFARGKAVDYVFQLLKEKPEQEANLLRLLVNKLGDSDKKIASKTSYNLLQLQIPHPLMKSTIIAAIESDLLFRPNQSLHAKYYAAITLNQTSLSTKQEDVTKQLLNIYFSLFKQLLAKPTITSADLISINKNGEVQGGGGASGKKALKKMALKEKSTATNDELREKVISAVLTGVNRAMPYTNSNDESFEKHMDTLFKVTHSSNFNTSIQALMLIQQLTAVHQGSADRFYRTLYESLLDPRLLTTSKQALYLNLLFKALRSDLSIKRVRAFMKRLLQVVSTHQPSFACAAVYLVREMETAFPSLQAFINQAEEGESDEEETFRDVQDGDEPLQKSPKSTGFPTGDKSRLRQAYDGRKRDPQHSNAENSCFWEVTPLLKHFHPSVSLFASRLTSHDIMPPKPDLASNTLAQFLDRFVYRNPKVTKKARGASIMQPMVGGDTSGLLVTTYSKSHDRAPVNTESFTAQGITKVAPDEVFFHKYFNAIGKGKEQAKKKKQKQRTQAADGSDVEEDEGEIWQALVKSGPELEEDSDAGMDSDLPESFSDDSDSVISTELKESSPTIDEDPEVDEGVLELEEDDDAVIGSDEDIPDLDKAFEEEVQFTPKPEELGMGNKGKRLNKQKLKNLPTFASADDYAKILDAAD